MLAQESFIPRFALNLLVLQTFVEAPCNVISLKKRDSYTEFDQSSIPPPPTVDGQMVYSRIEKSTKCPKMHNVPRVMKVIEPCFAILFLTLALSIGANDLPVISKVYTANASSWNMITQIACATARLSQI